MLKAIEELLVLQDRDCRILELTDNIDRLPQDEARSRARLSGDEAAVADAKAAVQQNGVDAKKLELDVETRRTTVTRLKQQQFETRKNEEFSALGHEIERYNDEVDGLETQQLELMEQADALRTTLEQAEGNLAKSRTVVEEDLESIAQRGRNLQAEREALSAERTQLAEEADKELLELYERLRVKKKGVAICPVLSGQCGGCHVKLIPATLIKVQAEKEVAQCENCGRILYIEN